NIGRELEKNVRTAPGDKSGKLMKSDAEERCHYLNDEGLCNVYINAGCDVMPVLCKAFPRLIGKYMGGYYKTLGFGCERVLEQLMKIKNGIQFVEKIEDEAEFIKDYERLQSNIEQKEIDERRMLAYYEIIRLFGISVLMDRRYSIEERVFLLGIGMKQLAELENSGNEEKTPAFVGAFMQDMENDAYREQLEGMARNEELKVKSVLGNVAIITRKGNKRNRLMRKIINDNIEAFSEESFKYDVVETEPEKGTIGVEQSYNSTYNTEKYAQKLSQYTDFIKGKEYFLENVAVMMYFNRSYPFTGGKGEIWESYLQFAQNFAAFKFMLVCGIEGQHTVQGMIDTTVNYSRNFENNTENTKCIKEFTQE
ncbi:MAG: flagellin lysine-N-methylase, partial [Oscillospiraceae bacterium]